MQADPPATEPSRGSRIWQAAQRTAAGRLACNVVSRLSPSARVLGALWSLFALLVLLRIHGSSLPMLAEWGKDFLGSHPEPAYVLGPVARLVGVDSLPPETRKLARGALMMQPQDVRIDEWGVFSPWALSQFSHQPRFPVVNTNLAGGQNMLLGFANPVLHVSALARPSTWGYLLLGPEHGHAWAWWFQPFACFTVLYLLLEIILRGERRLAAFGAFWFCASSYVVCWSLWAAYVTFFAGTLCLASYHIIVAQRRSLILGCGVLLGLALPGFSLCTYPPWQVPLGWVFFGVLLLLLWRDGVFKRWPAQASWRLLAFGIAGALTLFLVISYVRSSWDGMQALLGTVYPGKRFHPGGDYSFGWLLRGYYNLWTSYVTSRGFNNASEAASFIHLFPPILIALLVSGRARRELGSFGWLAVGFVIFLLTYMLVGLPGWFAKITLLGRSIPPRADIALGLLSIALCVWFLHRFPAGLSRPTDSRWERSVTWVVVGVTFLLTFVHGRFLLAITGRYPGLPLLVVVSGLVSLAGWALVSGSRRVFVSLVLGAVIVTGAPFNPLSVGMSATRESELVREVSRLNAEAGTRPLWLCYEPTEKVGLCGAAVTLAGGRSLTGVHQYPRLALWHQLDPEGRNEFAYNRYAHVDLVPCDDDTCLSFQAPGDKFWGGQGLPPNVFLLQAGPQNRVLRSWGTRFVIAVGALQNHKAFQPLKVRYRSALGTFSIFEIPTSDS